MTEILRHEYGSFFDWEIRAGGDGRTVYGLAVPFDTPTRVADWEGTYDETWRRGAFAETIRERGDRVKFLANHRKEVFPIGRATMLREDAAGLVGEFRVSKTQAGNDALELIRDGAVDSFSIGFVPVRSEETKDPDGALVAIERLEAKLIEVSAVAFPAFEGATIDGIRTKGPDQPDPDQTSRTRPDQPDPPDAARRLAPRWRLEIARRLP